MRFARIFINWSVTKLHYKQDFYLMLNVNCRAKAAQTFSPMLRVNSKTHALCMPCQKYLYLLHFLLLLLLSILCIITSHSKMIIIRVAGSCLDHKAAQQ